MLDPHKDALDRLHGVIADHLGKKFGKKEEPKDKEKKPSVLSISVSKEGHEEPDGDEGLPEGEGEEEEKPVSPGAQAALHMLRMMHK